MILAIYSLSGAAPIFLSQKAFAATPADEYVATTGADSSDCSNPGTPCQTIPYAISQADTGTTIHVAAGNYAGNDINVSKSVTLSGAPGAVITVPDGAGINGFDVHANDVTIEGFDIEGPATSSYLTYAWGGNVTRGIFIYNGVTGFNITGNTIQNLRNDILVDGRNTGSITNNTIDNSKSGISVQYTDAGTGNTEGYNVTISGNTQGTYGNEWGLNTHLNGHYDGATYFNNSQKIAANAPGSVQAALLANKAANGGWSVQDQGYSYSNRTEVAVSNAGSDSNQGSQLGPLATIQAGVTAVVSNGGMVNVKNGTYNGGVNVDKSGVSLVGESKAGVQVNATTATPYGQGVSVVGQDGVSISNMTFNDPTGSPISYAFQGYKDTNLSLSNLAFNGPGKTSTSHIGGVDVNSSQGVTYNNVSVSNYYKNGFSFTAQFTAPDDYSRDVNLNNITSNNNGWAGIAFYTMNGSNTVGHDISGVTFGGSNTVTNNGQGLFVEGDSDANHISHTTPAYKISGSGGAPVDLGSTAFSGNTQDIDNYQLNDLDALSATFAGQTGSQMSYSQRTALKTSGDIIDSATYPTFGTVNIFDAGSYVNDPSKSNFTTPKYIRSHNSGDIAAQALVPKDAESVRFTYTQTDGGNVYSNVVGTQHIQAGQFPVPATGQQQWRGGVSAEIGTYTVTGEYKVGGNWYPVTGSATAYVLGNPTGSFVLPSAGSHYFRPTDNPLRIKADDANNSFRSVTFNVNSTNYSVNRADCDLREAGNYVICDVSAASNWSGLPEGTYTGTATLFNQANNHTAITSQSFTIDGTRPTLSNFVITHTHPVYGSSVDVSADATDAISGIKNVKFYVTAPRAGDGVCDGNGTQLSSAEGSLGSGSTYAGTLDTSGLNGDYCLNAISEDNAANHSSPILHIKVTFDNTAPADPVLVSPPDNSVLNGSSITQSWSDSSSDVDHYIYESYNNASATSLRFHGTYTTTSKTATSVADTTYWWRVKAVDAAGNESGWSPLRKITVDNTAPAGLDNLSPSNGSSGTTASLTSIDWSDATDANVPITYYYESSLSPATNPDGSFTSPVYQSGALSSSQIPTPGTPQGIYYWHVRAVDAAGNSSSWTGPWEIIVDNTAPDTPAADLPAGDYAGTQSVSLSSSDSGGSGLANIYYTTDGSTPDNTSTLYTGPISVSQDETIKAVAYDHAGNVSGVLSSAYGIAPVISGEGSIGVTTDSITLVWETNQPATSRVLYDTVSHSSLGTDPNYGYAFSTAETDTSPKVTSHSVTITTGLTSGTTYYFRTVSHGSPESVSGEFSSITQVPSSNGSSTPTFSLTPVLVVATNAGTGTITAVGGLGGTVAGAVLGAATTTPNSTNDSKDSGQGHVKGAAAAIKSNNKAFLGLGWWWLLVLAAVLAGLYAFYRKQQNKEA